MGASRDDFIKYPRPPHLFGSKGTDDDKHLGRKESELFIADPSLIVEEKLDGTNVGIHFNSRGRMVLFTSISFLWAASSSHTMLRFSGIMRLRSKPLAMVLCVWAMNPLY